MVWRLGALVPWLLAAAVLVRRGDRKIGILVATFGVIVGVLSVGCSRLVPTPVGPAASLILPVVAAHLALAVPTGAVSRPVRLALGSGYSAAATTAAIYVHASAGRCAPGLSSASLSTADFTAGVIVGLVAASLRHRAERTTVVRIQWLAAGLIALTGVVAPLLAWALLSGGGPAALDVLTLAQLALPAALVAATSPSARGRASHAVRTATSMLALSGVALAALLVFLAVLGRFPEPAERPMLRLCLLVAYVGILMAPLVERRVSRSVQRADERDRETAEEMLRHLGGRLSRALPWEESLVRLAEALRESLRLSAVEIYSGSGGVLVRQVGLPGRGPVQFVIGPEQTAVLVPGGVRSGGWASVWLPEITRGREARLLRIAPLCAADELVGLIVVERIDDTDASYDEDDAILAELGAQVSLAMRNVRLDSALQASLAEVRRQADDLRASRARVVVAADAERRRIERDLHDGAQQSLIALSLSARAARRLVDSHNPAAAECLDTLLLDLRRTAEELRELAHGIYPPLLRDSGVGVALQFVAPRCCPGAIVDATRVRCPAPIEAAVYFCCLEAMQNAAKYAAGAPVRVRVWEADRTLYFEVRDDGPGFDTSRNSPGQGSVNMADRMGALGGSVRTSSAPGRGTAVRGGVPLAGVDLRGHHGRG